MFIASCSWLVCASFGCMMSCTSFINDNEKWTLYYCYGLIAGKRQFSYCLALGGLNKCQAGCNCFHFSGVCSVNTEI